MIDFVLKDRYNVADFVLLIDKLRSESGCPWDRVQTHESIRQNMLEEAYEAVEAIDEGDPAHLCEELGDLLMQVIFHTSIEKDAGRFDIDDVSDMACKKLIERHPHIFSDVKVSGADEVLFNWDKIKQKKRGQDTHASAMDGISAALPALIRAEKIQKKAANVGFDWPDVSGALLKLDEEVAELKEGINADDLDNIAEELGDIMFATVNVARFYKLHAETLLSAACNKFLNRFRYLEEGAQSRGLKLEDMSLAEMEEIYQEARHELEGKEPEFNFA